LIFITPPSINELKNRLVSRGTENEEQIEKRMQRTEQELQYQKSFDYVLINDKLDVAIEEIEKVVKKVL